MMERITLAHVSDLHLTAEDGAARSEVRLLGGLRGMNRNFGRLLADPPLRRADLVVVTGDVTDRGDLAAWERFWEMAETAGLAGRLAVLPGNHDVCCLGLRRTRPRVEDWARMRAGLARGGHESAFPWIRRLGPDAALFAVDSTNAGNASALDNARGRLGREQLVALGRALALYADVPHKFLLLHHSPNIPEAATSRRRGEAPTPWWERGAMQLDPFDRRALRLLAAVFRVKAILHGHTHDSLDRTVGGVRIVGAPAATEPDAAGALRYKLLTLYPESGRLQARLRRVFPSAEKPVNR
jgi:3',5'-cyclic AMP phosphodiesterase CpdA